MTGLALDDIQKIAENAEFKKLSMQVDLVLGLERISQNIAFCLPKSRFKTDSKTKITEAEKSSLAFFNKSYYLSWDYILQSILSGEEDEGSDSMDLILHKQREIKATMQNLTSKLDSLQEEFSELKWQLKSRKDQEVKKYKPHL